MRKNKELIGIITAVDPEVEILTEYLQNKETILEGKQTFYKGKFGKTNVVITTSGMGKVNAAISATIMIKKYHVTQVLFSGCAGSLRTYYSQGDMVISSRLAEHDMDATYLGYSAGYVPGTNTTYFSADPTMASKLVKIAEQHGIKVGIGTIVSGDQFISTKEKKDWLIKTFDGVCTEMEGASVAHTCYVLGVPFCVIRTISDNADGSSCEEYNTFVSKAGKISAEVVIDYVKGVKGEVN